jgi:hypothetical protein
VNNFLKIVAITAILAVVASGPAPRVDAASSGVQYDQLVKLVLGSQATPEPGSFEPDWQASMNAIQSANGQPQHHGLFGNIMNSLNQAKNAMSIFQTGMPSTEYYWNGWERADDPGTQMATITKPQQHQIIFLDLKNKTYRIEDTTVHPMTFTPPPYERPQGPSGSPPPSPQPGTAKVKITVSTTSLGSKAVGGQQADGYKFDFKIASTQATGSCTNGTFETAMIVWDSRLPEPKLASVAGPPIVKRPPAPNPELGSFKMGCKPTVTARTHIGTSPPSNRLAMWQLVALNAGAQTSQGSAQGGFSTMIERGNVKTLGPADASLFEIPAGFTQATLSPSP